MTGADIERAIATATPLINPRLSEVDWDAVAGVLTPVAPEVPPRRDGLREALLDIGTDHEDHRLRVIRDEPGDFPPSWVLACEDEDEAPALLDFAALERATPEPPDSGDGAAWAKAFEEWKRNPPPLQVLPGDAGIIDAALLAKAMEAARPAIEKADSVGLRYRAIHDDALCARDEHGCGCLCHTAAAIVREYAHLSARGAE